jgi:hypothetical protein
MQIKRLCFISVLLPVLVFGQLSSFQLNGYAKYLFSTSYSSQFHERLNDHLIHNRINTRWYPTSALTTALDLRFRAYYGDSVEDIPGFSDQIKTKYDFVQLDAMLWNRKKTLGYAEIDRLFLDYYRGSFQVTAGRQRVAWGTSLVWNIIDIFNPMSILDFDYEERPGTDAIRIQYYTGAVSKIEAVWKPGKNKYRNTFAGLWSINKWAYDFFIIAALQNNRKILAGAWSGDIRGGGFRGELKISEPPSKGQENQYQVPLSSFSNLTDYNQTVISFVLSGDYTFPNTFYIHTETMFNSNGKLKNAGIYWQQAPEAGMLSPSRWSVYQEFAYDITPLVRGTVFGLFNPNDQSYLMAPSVTWSITSNFEFLGLVYFTQGEKYTEFGDFDTTIFTRLKYSF